MQNTGMTTTDVLAIIGAVTGIIGTIAGLAALGWDYYKWINSERVRLKVSATPGFISTDNPYQKYIHVTVTNVGKVPTTVKMLSLHGFNSKKELKKRNGKDVAVVLNPVYGKLPVKLNPGDDWAGGITENTEVLERYSKYEYFFIQIEDSMSEFPFRAEVDKALLTAGKNS